MYDVANEVFDEFSERIASKNVTVDNQLSQGTVLNANRTLIY